MSATSISNTFHPVIYTIEDTIEDTNEDNSLQDDDSLHDTWVDSGRPMSTSSIHNTLVDSQAIIKEQETQEEPKQVEPGPVLEPVLDVKQLYTSIQSHLNRLPSYAKENQRDDISLSFQQLAAGIEIMLRYAFTRWVILLAQMQSGKTETYLFIAAEMIRLQLVQNVVIFSGNAECYLRNRVWQRTRGKPFSFLQTQRNTVKRALQKNREAALGKVASAKKEKTRKINEGKLRLPFKPTL